MKENQKLVPREGGFFLWDNFPGRGFFRGIFSAGFIHENEFLESTRQRKNNNLLYTLLEYFIRYLVFLNVKR